MAELVVVYWRDIPAQIIARAGRRSEKRQLSDRFQEAIDMAAMRSGASGTDTYLEEWRRGEPQLCSDDLATEADRLAAEFERIYDRDQLKRLIANGGRSTASSPAATEQCTDDGVNK